MLRRLADFAHRRRWFVLAATIVFVSIAGPIGGPVATVLISGGSPMEDPAAESVEVRETLERATGASTDPSMIVLVRTEDVRSAEGRERVEAVARRIEEDPAVARLLTAFTTGNPALISNDGRSSYMVVLFKPAPVNEKADHAERIYDELKDEPGVLFGGADVVGFQVSGQIESDLARAEAVAFPILLLLSLLIFRGVVAALLPLLAGAVGIFGAFLGLRILNEFVSLSVFALNLVIAVGLGLAIDYSLFIVSRYREELERVGPGPEAIRRTLATAGRTVAFSALTVAAALAALLVFPQRFLYSMGAGGVLVALISGAVALVLLPALLAVLGPRVNALSLARWRHAAQRTARGDEAGFWYRFAHGVMRRATLAAAATAALLIVVGLPFLGIEFTGVNAGVLPTSASARQVYDALNTEFDRNRTEPTYIAVEAPGSARSEVEAYADELRRLPGAAAVDPPQPVGPELWRVDLISQNAAFTDPSQRLVEDIRSLEPPFPATVGGTAAAFTDEQDSFAAHLPVGIAILALTTILILFAMTGSVLLPLKALVMNALTVSAVFGILVLIFQDGNLESLLDFTSEGALNSSQPILIGFVVFALSTDYGVFLFSRIKEAKDKGEGNTEAVAAGLERTGRIVTAAAVLFCIAVGAFATSQIILIKQAGVGIALGVLIDATIVRALLVPSLMKLLGEWNWWAPAPLRRVHDRLGLRDAYE